MLLFICGFLIGAFIAIIMSAVTISKSYACVDENEFSKKLIAKYRNKFYMLVDVNDK